MKEVGQDFLPTGPFVYRTKTDNLLLICSSFNDGGYLIGIAESKSGKINGPWVQQTQPLFITNVGRGMFFNDFEGRLRMVLHQPNYNGRERANIYRVEDVGNRLQVKEN